MTSEVTQAITHPNTNANHAQYFPTAITCGLSGIWISIISESNEKSHFLLEEMKNAARKILRGMGTWGGNLYDSKGGGK